MILVFLLILLLDEYIVADAFREDAFKDLTT